MSDPTYICKSRVTRDESGTYNFGYDIEVAEDDDFDIQDCEDYDKKERIRNDENINYNL